MPAKSKIVFLGASRAAFGMSMFRDLFSTSDLTGSELILVGRNTERLGRSLRLAQPLNEKTGAGLKIVSTTDWRAALGGAEFVVHSTAIDRIRLWRLDFEVPRKYGIRHTLGENGGPGRLFFRLRTLLSFGALIDPLSAPKADPGELTTKPLDSSRKIHRAWGQCWKPTRVQLRCYSQSGVKRKLPTARQRGADDPLRTLQRIGIVAR